MFCHYKPISFFLSKLYIYYYYLIKETFKISPPFNPNHIGVRRGGRNGAKSLIGGFWEEVSIKNVFKKINLWLGQNRDLDQSIPLPYSNTIKEQFTPVYLGLRRVLRMGFSLFLERDMTQNVPLPNTNKDWFTPI